MASMDEMMTWNLVSAMIADDVREHDGSVMQLPEERNAAPSSVLPIDQHADSYILSLVHVMHTIPDGRASLVRIGSDKWCAEKQTYVVIEHVDPHRRFICVCSENQKFIREFCNLVGAEYDLWISLEISALKGGTLMPINHAHDVAFSYYDKYVQYVERQQQRAK